MVPAAPTPLPREFGEASASIPLLYRTSHCNHTILRMQGCTRHLLRQGLALCSSLPAPPSCSASRSPSFSPSPSLSPSARGCPHALLASTCEAFLRSCDATGGASMSRPCCCRHKERQARPGGYQYHLSLSHLRRLSRIVVQSKMPRPVLLVSARMCFVGVCCRGARQPADSLVGRVPSLATGFTR